MSPRGSWQRRGPAVAVALDVDKPPLHLTSVYRRFGETVASAGRTRLIVRAVHAIPICATLLALAVSPGRAPSADEARLYDEGLRAFQAGDARAAEKAWKAGYAVAHDPAFLVHIGEAQEKAGAPAEAADSYRHYLREAPDAADRADIEQRLARLAPSPPPGGPPPGAAPAEAPGEFGASPPAPSLAPPAAQPSADAERPGRPNRPAQEDSGWNRYNITAVTSAGVAVLALGVTALFAAQASSDNDDLHRLIVYRDQITGAPLQYSAIADQYERAMADGPRHDRNAKIAFVVAGVAAAVSATFFVLDAKFGAEPAVAVVPAGRGLAATGGWQWRF